MRGQERAKMEQTIQQLRELATAAYETLLASGVIVDIHKDMLDKALQQRSETLRIWLELSKKLHDAEVAE